MVVVVVVVVLERHLVKQHTMNAVRGLTADQHVDHADLDVPHRVVAEQLSLVGGEHIDHLHAAAALGTLHKQVELRSGRLGLRGRRKQWWWWWWWWWWCKIGIDAEVGCNTCNHNSSCKVGTALSSAVEDKSKVVSNAMLGALPSAMAKECRRDANLMFTS